MIEMARVMKDLGPAADKVQVLFVTLDPQRDTREVLAQYVPAFDKRFIGLYGNADQTAAVAKEFKIFYSKVPGKNADNYTLDHTAGTYVFDRDGKLRLFVRNGQDPRSIVHDIRQLLS
jgi:protein SCO1/2